MEKEAHSCMLLIVQLCFLKAKQFYSQREHQLSIFCLSDYIIQKSLGQFSAYQKRCENDIVDGVKNYSP